MFITKFKAVRCSPPFILSIAVITVISVTTATTARIITCSRRLSRPSATATTAFTARSRRYTRDISAYGYASVTRIVVGIHRSRRVIARSRIVTAITVIAIMIATTTATTAE